MTLEAELTDARNVLGSTAKRELIETELRKDAGRSDREIARIVGCDHKTVGCARARLRLPSPLGNSGAPIPTEFRSSVVKCPPPPSVVDEPEYDPFDPRDGDVVIPHQPAIAVYENTSGAVVIRQEMSAREDEDPVILVRPEHVEKLVARLRQVAKEVLS